MLVCRSSAAQVGSSALGHRGVGAVAVPGEGLPCELCPPRAKKSHEMSKIIR